MRKNVSKNKNSNHYKWALQEQILGSDQTIWKPVNKSLSWEMISFETVMKYLEKNLSCQFFPIIRYSFIQGKLFPCSFAILWQYKKHFLLLRTQYRVLDCPTYSYSARFTITLNQIKGVAQQSSANFLPVAWCANSFSDLVFVCPVQIFDIRWLETVGGKELGILRNSVYRLNQFVYLQIREKFSSYD